MPGPLAGERAARREQVDRQRADALGVQHQFLPAMIVEIDGALRFGAPLARRLIRSEQLGQFGREGFLPGAALGRGPAAKLHAQGRVIGQRANLFVDGLAPGRGAHGGRLENASHWRLVRWIGFMALQIIAALRRVPHSQRASEGSAGLDRIRMRQRAKTARLGRVG